MTQCDMRCLPRGDETEEEKEVEEEEDEAETRMATIKVHETCHRIRSTYDTRTLTMG